MRPAELLQQNGWQLKPPRLSGQRYAAKDMPRGLRRFAYADDLPMLAWRINRAEEELRQRVDRKATVLTAVDHEGEDA